MKFVKSQLLKDVKYQITKSLPVDGLICSKSIELTRGDLFIIQRALSKFNDSCFEIGADDVAEQGVNLHRKIHKLVDFDVNVI